MAPPSNFRLTPGRLVYLLFHQPLTACRDFADRVAGERGERAMRASAATLAKAQLDRWALSGPPVRFLTGERFAHQTIFCARSFEWACGTHTRLEIFDDGTLRGSQVEVIRRALPHATIIDSGKLDTRLSEKLPQERFPLLRLMREANPLMRKLLDLHVGQTGPSLYLDSDMLFFAAPRIVRDWLRKPSGEFFMAQSADALIGERLELERRLGCSILLGVNSGILGLDDSGFDWEGLERAAAALTAEERAHKWAEQTLFAIHLSLRKAQPLPFADYVLCNAREDLGPNPPPLRHYVHKSKTLYGAREWRRWLDISRSASNTKD